MARPVIRPPGDARQDWWIIQEVARRIGLDWISLTDHNVTTQNRNLKADSGKGVLLLGGEEMTNWFHGHATVTGLSPGAWLDWRQRPAGVPLGPNEERIQSFIAEAKRLGAYTAAAHPAGANLSWQFFADAEADPAALPDGLEVWNGLFQPDDEVTLKSGTICSATGAGSSRAAAATRTGSKTRTDSPPATRRPSSTPTLSPRTASSPHSRPDAASSHVPPTGPRST